MRVVLTAAFAALVLSGFGGLRATGASGPETPLAETYAVQIPPAQIDRAVARVDGLAREMMQRTGIPGMAIAVVHNDRVVFAKAYGVRKVGTNERVDTNTVFQLASVSKPLGATVVARLVGKGVVKWDDPIAKYIPWFTLSDPWVGKHVTIADMYAHRSGLPGMAGDLLEDLGFDRMTIIRRLALVPLDPFRISYHYANFGTTTGGEAAAHAAGMSWEALSKKELYDPLGMRSTSSRFVDLAGAPNHAVLHVRVDGRWVAKYTRQPDAQSPAGGASSTVNDMAKWLRLQLANGKFEGRQIVVEDALLAMRQPQVMSGPPRSPNGRALFNGLGLVVDYDATGRLQIAHAGAFSQGASTAVAMLPSEKLGIVILTNAQPIGLSEGLSREFFELVERGTIQHDWLGILGPKFEQLLKPSGEYVGKVPPANAPPSRALAAYAGTYDNAFYGPALVEQRGRRLAIRLGPHHTIVPMRHWSGDTYVYSPPWNDSGVGAITFRIGADGNATSMRVEDLDEHKLGTFTKAF